MYIRILHHKPYTGILIIMYGTVCVAVCVCTNTTFFVLHNPQENLNNIAKGVGWLREGTAGLADRWRAHRDTIMSQIDRLTKLFLCR